MKILSKIEIFRITFTAVGVKSRVVVVKSLAVL